MPGRTAMPLHLYRREAPVEDLPWDDVEAQLVAAGTYWTVGVPARAAVVPHPRPVWGVWLPSPSLLLLTIGSPTLGADLAGDDRVTVHLDSGTEVVIVEGAARPVVVGEPGYDSLIKEFLAVYNPKYDWDYSVDELGTPTAVTPSAVLAWRSGGFAGREGFKLGGKWRFS